MAEAHGNRTHRAHLPANPTGFEVQASHQARFTSAFVGFYQNAGRKELSFAAAAILTADLTEAIRPGY